MKATRRRIYLERVADLPTGSPPVEVKEHPFYRPIMPPEQFENPLRCGLCGSEKPPDAFHRRGAGRQRWCKACRRVWDAAYHARTRDVRLRQVVARKRRLSEWLNDLKASQPCSDCGGWFHPAAMEFDHLPGTNKRDNVSDLVRSGRANLARREVLKCDVVCANCHAVRTYMRRRYGVASIGGLRSAGDDFAEIAAPYGAIPLPYAARLD